MEDEVSGGTRERYRRLLAVVQETEEGERISDQNSPNIAKHESGSEEKGVQEDDLKRRQAAQTHTHERPPSRETSKNEPRVLRAIDSLVGRSRGRGGRMEVVDGRFASGNEGLDSREGGRRGGAEGGDGASPPRVAFVAC